ncbi:hypothetical protein [Solibacillus sp. FSL K6-1523]|uniref:hypothetical protein n=1 Tax=Solibacillus sp. FSL K6-1523 TaxID=2921471 RepID=UPI0030F5ED70
MGNYVLPTGVLEKAPRAVSAVINLVNLVRKAQDVEVEVWDLSSFSNPVKLPVLTGNNIPVIFPYRLPPVTFAEMYASLTGVLFYEIRIIHLKARRIIANCFGRSITSVAQEGNTVLDQQLIKIDLNCSC